MTYEPPDEYGARNKALTTKMRAKLAEIRASGSREEVDVVLVKFLEEEGKKVEDIMTVSTLLFGLVEHGVF